MSTNSSDSGRPVRSARPFAAQVLVERAPIAEARQRIGAGEALQAHLRVPPPAQLAREQRGAADDRDAEHEHQHAEPLRPNAPLHEDVPLGGRHVDDDRQPLQPLVHVKPPHAIDRRDAGEHARVVLAHVRVEGRVGDAASDHLRIERQARDHQPVGLEDGRRAVRAHRKTVEQRAEVVDAERADDDAAERAVGARDAPAERDRRRAVAQPRRVRLADVEAAFRVIALVDEIVAIREVRDGRRMREVRVEHDVAVLVHHGDRAEVLAGGRAVEQHLGAYRGIERHDARIVHAVDDRLQRQVVELDVARDVAFEQQHEIVCVVDRMQVCVPVRLVQHACAKQPDQREQQHAANDYARRRHQALRPGLQETSRKGGRTLAHDVGKPVGRPDRGRRWVRTPLHRAVVSSAAAREGGLVRARRLFGLSCNAAFS